MAVIDFDQFGKLYRQLPKCCAIELPLSAIYEKACLAFNSTTDKDFRPFPGRDDEQEPLLCCRIERVKNCLLVVFNRKHRDLLNFGAKKKQCVAIDLLAKREAPNGRLISRSTLSLKKRDAIAGINRELELQPELEKCKLGVHLIFCDIFRGKQHRKMLLLQEYYEKGTLSACLKSLTFDEKISIVSQLFEQLCKLEKMSLSHRDLHLNNILLKKREKELVVSISDFEYAVYSVKPRVDVVALGVLIDQLFDLSPARDPALLENLSKLSSDMTGPQTDLSFCASKFSKKFHIILNNYHPS